LERAQVTGAPAQPPPSAEEQLAFLSKIQRLYAEGDFTATYKFALLVALADLAVELGHDDGAELPLTVRQIAERFVALYWHHARPYMRPAPGVTAQVLSQNLGAQAAVLLAIEAFQARWHQPSLLKARTLPDYAALVTKVAAVVSKQPLTYLQNLGGATDPFLYRRTGAGRITLGPGVAYCLRRFYPLVQQLSRSHWVAHIKDNRRNRAVLGEDADLEAFLFSASRESLEQVGRLLRKLEGSHCFYCGGSVADGDIDHFIPFALYPRDLTGNFVLTHPTCNRSKSDTLAARPHLERWLERLHRKADQILEIAATAGLPAEPITLRKVAAWGYGSAYSAGARAWLAPRRYEPVDGVYLRLLDGLERNHGAVCIGT
jgi:5-methylcytosine-specific restriction endonuclease McrA